MSEPTDHGEPPAPGNEHDQPTVVDVRRAPDAAPSGGGVMPAIELPPDDMPPPLSRMGEYELLREIGRGGMGIVYQARHVRLGRIVALKMIIGGGLAPAEDLQRFDTEVSAAARLQHAGIVALYEVSTQTQQPYFSMEYVSGQSLAQRLALGPMSNRRAAAYMEAVARAVHHAHTKGIIHRDLKPANVLLDEHDQPKVTDFGLAKLVATESGQTRTGAVLGTPSYMSPEQAAGERHLGPASDIWSLGTILYELLTGRPPFRGETAMATLQQVVDKEPVPPRLLDPSIDRDLETICLKCLEKEPSRRYSSAEAFADDLRRFLDEEAIAARRRGWVDRAIRWCRRRPALAALLAMLVVALITFGVLQMMAQKEEAALRRLAQVREEAMRHLLYLAEMRRAQQAIEQADFDRVERLLKHWEHRDDQRDLRDWEWYFLHSRIQPRHTIRAHAYQASSVVWRPDGKQFASAGGEPNKPATIKLWDAPSGKLLATMTGHKLAITSLAWHPHKNLLASGSFDATVKLWDTAAHEEVASLTGHRGEVKSVAFAPQGQRLASAGRDMSIRVWEAGDALGGKTEPIVLQGHEGEVNSVLFAPEGLTLASASSDKSVRLWSLTTLKTIHVLEAHEGPVECLAFSPAGALLASGGGAGLGRGEVKVWHPGTGALLANRFGLGDRVRSLSCTTTGLLAAGCNDGIVHIWDQTRTSERITFRADKQVLDLAFSPDGHTLAVAGSTGRVSRFNSDGSLESLRLPAPAPVEALAFNPAGKTLAAAGRNGSLNIWNLDHPEQAVVLGGHTGTVTSAAYAPNGAWLAAGTQGGAILLHECHSPDQKSITLTGHDGLIRALVVAPDGSFLASACDDDTVRIWDVESRTTRRVLKHGNGVRALAVSANGRWLASGGVDKLVYLWDVTTGAAVKLEGHKGTVNALAFSPDSQTLISGSSDRTIRLWNVEEQREAPGLEGLSAPVLALAYHPGGRRFASLGQDKTIRLWDVVTRQEILELGDNGASSHALAFSPDGRWLAATTSFAVRMWDSGESQAPR